MVAQLHANEAVVPLSNASALRQITDALLKALRQAPRFAAAVVPSIPAVRPTSIVLPTLRQGTEPIRLATRPVGQRTEAGTSGPSAKAPPKTVVEHNVHIHFPSITLQIDEKVTPARARQMGRLFFDEHKARLAEELAFGDLGEILKGRS